MKCFSDLVNIDKLTVSTRREVWWNRSHNTWNCCVKHTENWATSVQSNGSAYLQEPLFQTRWAVTWNACASCSLASFVASLWQPVPQSWSRRHTKPKRSGSPTVSVNFRLNFSPSGVVVPQRSWDSTCRTIVLPARVIQTYGRAI